ncbi:MAG TPA: protein kinase [Kofleriaceae bacterium]|nr:protein kinase [Kofleriaceae bacterium]
MATTPRTVDAGVRLGEIFVEKYRVDAILGHGGMGVVAQCTHLALNERVAIKMLRRDVLDDADAVERFMREAQAASKLRSEYVARVTDVGRSDANVPYMVMEYLEGHDLDELLEQRGTISRAWAVELTLQACEALAEAHSLGIVHRDIKPSNLFVTWRLDGSALIKVLDFGISKALTNEAMVLTQTQSLLGTPAYMSPEQMRSARHVDARTDIWSLGTVLFEMLEGRRPFEAESFSEMCVKVAVDPPGPMPNTPPALQQVVMRCLAKPPEQRYASMAELGRDLVPFARNPHQAQLLAERMARTLRRSPFIDWSPAAPGPQAQFAPQVHLAPQTHLVPQIPALTPMAPVLPAPPIAAAAAARAVTPSAASTAAIDPTPARGSAPGAAVSAVAAANAASADAAAIHAAATGATEPAILSPHATAATSLSTTYRIPGRRRRRVTAAIIAAVVAATAIGVVVSRARTGSPPHAPIARPSSAHSPAVPTAAAKTSDPAVDGPAAPSAKAPAAPGDPAAGASAAAASTGAPHDGAPAAAASTGDGTRTATKPTTSASAPSTGTPGASPATASAHSAAGGSAPATTGSHRAAPSARPPPLLPATGGSGSAAPTTNATAPARPAHDDNCAFRDAHDGCAPSGSPREN